MNSCSSAPIDELLQADEPADAVIDVDDEVADLQIAEIGDEGSRRGSPSFVRPALLFEQVGLGENLQAGSWEVESLGELAGRDEHRGVFEIVGRADRAAAHLVLVQQFERSLGAAGRGRHEDRDVAAVARLANLVDPVANPAPVLQSRGTGDV